MSDQDNDKWDAHFMKGGALHGQCGTLTEKTRVPWRQRIREQHHLAEREAGKAERLDELNKLLDAYPAVARILELVDELGD